MEKPSEKMHCELTILPDSVHQRLLHQVAKEAAERKNRKKYITTSRVIARAVEEYLDRCQKA